jgi:hypothetical protein
MTEFEKQVQKLNNLYKSVLPHTAAQIKWQGEF